MGSNPMGRWTYQILNGKSDIELLVISIYQSCTHQGTDNGMTFHTHEQAFRITPSLRPSTAKLHELPNMLRKNVAAAAPAIGPRNFTSSNFIVLSGANFDHDSVAASLWPTSSTGLTTYRSLSHGKAPSMTQRLLLRNYATLLHAFTRSHSSAGKTISLI